MPRNDRAGIALTFLALVAFGSWTPARGAPPGDSTFRLGPWLDPVDPDGDCRITLGPGESEGRIRVPGAPHLLSVHLGRINAPRVLREVGGDFTMTARVGGIDSPSGRSTMKAFQPYHGAGLLVWVDEKNYIRLESATELRLPEGVTDYNEGKPYFYTNFECWADGKLVSSRGQKRVEGPTYLRLERSGNKVLASFGTDTLTWTKFDPLDLPLPDRVRVGYDAISTASNPFEASFRESQVEPLRPVPAPPTPNPDPPRR